METEDILISLSKLEDSLTELDSAKNLVEKTVNSYNIVGTKIETYVTILDSVSKNTKALIEVIKNSHVSYIEETNQQLQYVVESFSKSVNEVNEISGNFKKRIDATEQILSTQINNIHNQFIIQNKEIVSQFKESTDKAKISFTSQITDSIKAFNEAADKILQSSAIVNTTIKEELSEGRKAISDMKKELLHANKEHIHTLSQGIHLLEKRNQILQRWNYIIIGLILLSFVLSNFIV